jgi:hypothetical protein
MQEPIFSKSLQTKTNMYFFEVKEAKNGSKYVSVTESRTSKDGQKFRSSIAIFPSNIEEFFKIFEEAKQKLK